MLTPQILEGFVVTVLAKDFDEPTPTPNFHRELWELCCSDHPLVAIGAPRGHAKSTAITHSYTLASVLFRDSQFVLIVSDTEGQAVEFLRDIKKELQTNETLINLFGVKTIIKDAETDIICEMEDGWLFRIMAKGSEQKVRGLKWNNKRPDLIIGDDLENDEIVMNQDRRDKFKRWFRGALMPCLGPRGKIRIVGTVLHMGSLLNDLLPRPWIKSAVQEPLRLYDTNPKQMWKSVKYRAHNEDYSKILWPDRFSAHKLKEIRKERVEAGYPDMYSQEYLNEPIDDSVSFFKKTDFVEQTVREKEDIKNGNIPLLYYAGCDLAISQKERADYSVFHVVAVDSNNTIYHIDTIRERMDGKEIIDTIIALQAKYKLQWLAIEKERISQAIGPFLREEMKKRGVFVSLVEITPSVDKPTRARTIQARMRIGSVKFNRDAVYFPVLEQEFLRFPRDIHDDQIDAYSCIGLGLDKMVAANTPQEQQEEEWDEFDTRYDFDGFSLGRNSFTGY